MNDQLRQQMAAGAVVPQPQAADSPDEFKFVNPGDEIFGQVTRAQFGFKTRYTDPGDPATLGNVIEVNDDRLGPRTVWLTNVQLRYALVEGNNPLGRPVRASDVVFIRLDGIEPLDGGNTVKNYSINLMSGSGQVAAQAQPAAQQQAAVPPPTAATPWGNQAAAQAQVPQAPQQQAPPPPTDDDVPF